MKRVLIPALLVGLSGCSLAPYHETPTLDMPDKADKEGNAFLEYLASNNWWYIFNDSRLNELEVRAISNNHDLAIAVKNIQEAMSALNMKNADLWPTAALQASENKYYLSTEGTSAAKTPQARDVKAYGFNIGLAYELDIFGQKRDLSTAYLNKLLATRESKNAVFLTLTASVAKAYFALLSIGDQLKIAKKTLKTRQQTYDIYLCRFKNGYCKELDLRRVEAEKLVMQSKVLGLESAYHAARTALAVLLGASPKEIADDTTKYDCIRNVKLVDSTLSYIPSTLLLKRPDIAAAEYELAAANANIGVARAAFFPSISLTTSVGSESFSLSSLFDEPTDRWSIGGQIQLPIFNGGKLLANEKMSRIRYEKALENYKKVVKTAFKEVSDAIVLNDKNRLILKSTEQREAAMQRGYYLAQQQQNSGLIGLVDLLDVERNLLAAKMEHIQAIENALNSTVDLCRAIGCIANGTK